LLRGFASAVALAHPFVLSEVEARSASTPFDFAQGERSIESWAKARYPAPMIRPALTLAAAALLATSSTAQVRSQTAKTYSDALAALQDIPRRAALRRAILDSGEKCVRVDKAAYQGPYKNLEMWVATCTGNFHYGAFLGPDGTVQVSDCAYLIKVKWPACRKL
jgi:hypothetical protein